MLIRGTFSGLLIAVGLLSSVLEGQVPPPKLPDGVTVQRDLAYVEGGHERQKLDLYLPAPNATTGTGPAPLIIWMHGGGWRSGNKEQCLPLRWDFLQRGYAVASVGYRLSSHATFPAQIEDCKAAVRWLRANAGKYGIDPERFAAWGTSSGGYLAALLGTSGDVKDFDVGPNLDESSRVQAVCDFYGQTDFTAMVNAPGYEQHAERKSAESKLLGGPVLENKAQADRASVVARVSADDPPFLIVHGSEDRAVPPVQSQILFAALTKAGVSVRRHTVRGTGHGGHAFTSSEIRKIVRTFFNERLKQKITRVDAVETESVAVAKPARLKAPAPKPPVPSMAGIEALEITGDVWKCKADGTPMEGVIFKPEGSGPFPALVVNHGLGANAAQFTRLKAREFVKWGFVCIATNLTHAGPKRGSDRSQYGASPENLRRARTCVAILRSLPEVDPKRICAYGNSMGAYLTIAMAAELPGELAAAAITAGGVVTKPGLSAPSVDVARRVRTPMLMLHGAIDTSVLPEYSARLKTTLDANGIVNERHVFEGIGHSLHNEHPTEVFRLMQAWFTARGVLN